MSFDDPRLVDLYDTDNPDGSDHDLYRALADEIGARTIVDLGCGTGMLTVTLARPGRTVVGIDPSAAMLAVARRRTGGDGVAWVEGDASALADGAGPTIASAVDYAVLTGNTAQHIPDPAWQRALAALRGSMRDGGVLAFESRLPERRAWEAWAAEPPSTRDSEHGRLREWWETSDLGDGRIRLESHTVFEATGEHVVDVAELAFRSRATIEGQLREAGFAVEQVWGDFRRGEVTDRSAVMVVRARAV